MMQLIRKQAAWIALAIGLVGCSPEGKQAFEANMGAAVKNADQALQNMGAVAAELATDVKDNVYKTSYQVQKWAATPPEKLPPHPIQQSYCYRSFHDVLCYRAPMPGAENRLVSYQGTYAEPPPQPVMQLLPTHPYDPSQTPASRVANARPVFIGLPPETKPDANTKQADAAVADQTVEPVPQLPNPLLVPQL